MHITFISDKSNFYKNQELLESNRFLKWNSNIFNHINNGEVLPDSNLYILFGDVDKILFGKPFKNSFHVDNNKYYYSIENYGKFDNDTKTEQNKIFKLYKIKINSFLEKYAIVKVTNNSIYYKDINFKTLKRKNTEDSWVKYIEDKDGKFKSYDGKILKEVSGDFQTIKPTYDANLNSNKVFHNKNYGKIRYSKFTHYFNFDIETAESLRIDTTPEPIISIAGYSNVYNSFFIWVLKNSPDQDISEKIALSNIEDNSFIEKLKIFEFTDEVKMLNHFIKVLIKLDIDMMVGWYIHGYDLPYLYNRCKKLGVDPTNLFKTFKQKNNKDGSRNYSCENIILFDLMNYYKFVTKKNKPKSFRLDDVAEHILGRHKVKHSGIVDMWKNDINKLIGYNLEDVSLVEQINNKARLLKNAYGVQQIVPQDFETVFYTSTTIDNFIHMIFNDLKFPTKIRRTKGKKYDGALVIKSERGLYKNCAVFDFKSLYPSIILTFNISPETLVTDEPYDPKTMAKIGDHVFRQTTKGIIPKTIEYFLNKRKELNIEKNKYDGNSVEYDILTSHELYYKLLSNSVYGCMGYVNWFLYSEACAESVTYIGRNLLRHSKDKVESNGYRIVFGDTDSVSCEIVNHG